MAGYSGTPLAKKLGIRDGFRLCFENAPARFRRALGPLPEGVVVQSAWEADADLLVLFPKDRVELVRLCPKLAAGSLEPPPA